MRQWRKLGEIFVEQGLLTSQTVERMLFVSMQRKTRFGAVLEEMGLVTADELAAALSQQFGLEVVAGFYSWSYAPEVLNLVSLEQAIQHFVFPLRSDGAILELAMADPSDIPVIKSLSASSNLTIIPRIATKDDLHAAICKYYLGIEQVETVTKTILVAVDNLTSLDAIKMLLSNQNFSVVSATNGVEALAAITTHNPQTIIVNRAIPHPDQLDFVKYVKSVSETRHIPIILVSGQMTPEEEEEAFALGFFDYINLPINKSALITSIKRAFWNIKRRNRAF